MVWLKEQFAQLLNGDVPEKAKVLSLLVRITFVDDSRLSLVDSWLTTEEHYNNNYSI
jgi:hypothetical protein